MVAAGSGWPPDSHSRRVLATTSDDAARSSGATPVSRGVSGDDCEAGHARATGWGCRADTPLLRSPGARQQLAGGHTIPDRRRLGRPPHPGVSAQRRGRRLDRSVPRTRPLPHGCCPVPERWLGDAQAACHDCGPTSSLGRLCPGGRGPTGGPLRLAPPRGGDPRRRPGAWGPVSEVGGTAGGLQERLGRPRGLPFAGSGSSRGDGSDRRLRRLPGHRVVARRHTGRLRQQSIISGRPEVRLGLRPEMMDAPPG